MNARLILGAVLLSLSTHVNAQPPPQPRTNLFVFAECPDPIVPYDSLWTAATNIQDAIDIAAPGAVIHVFPGVYDGGGREVVQGHLNRIAVLSPMTIRSEYGPSLTTIKGGRVYGYGYGYGFGYGYGYIGTRCAYLTDGAVLDGFTLTDGHTMDFGDEISVQSGGGIWVDPAWAAIITNCIIDANDAQFVGGGAYGGKLFNCILRGNTCSNSGGGAYGAELYGCTVTMNGAVGGGGICQSSAYASRFEHNYATFGGAIYVSSAIGCLMRWNSGSGSAALSSSLKYCTIIGNPGIACVNGIDISGCVFMGNSGGDIHPIFSSVGSVRYSRISVITAAAGEGTFTNDPELVDSSLGDGRLLPTSPCIDASLADDAPSVDLNGTPRPLDGNHDGIVVPDMGAYEFLDPLSDSDSDGMGDADELNAGTGLTDGTSYLGIEQTFQKAGSTGIVVVWQSVAGKLYGLDRTTNLVTGTPFTGIASNIVGLAGTTSYTDTTATASGPYIYRVGVTP